MITFKSMNIGINYFNKGSNTKLDYKYKQINMSILLRITIMHVFPPNSDVQHCKTQQTYAVIKKDLEYCQ